MSCFRCYSFASITTASLNNPSCTRDIKSISKMRTNKVVFLQILRFQTLSLMKKPATQQSMRTVRKCFSTLKSKNKTSPGFNAQFFNRNPYTFQFCNEMKQMRSADMSSISWIFPSASYPLNKTVTDGTEQPPQSSGDKWRGSQVWEELTSFSNLLDAAWRKQILQEI